MTPAEIVALRQKRGISQAGLARLMELPKHEAHIGMFDVAKCRRLVELLSA